MGIFKKKNRYSILKYGDKYLVEIKQTTNDGLFQFEEKFPTDKNDGLYIPICDFIDCEYGKDNGFNPAIFNTKEEAGKFISELSK